MPQMHLADGGLREASKDSGCGLFGLFHIDLSKQVNPCESPTIKLGVRWKMVFDENSDSQHLDPIPHKQKANEVKEHLKKNL